MSVFKSRVAIFSGLTFVYQITRFCALPQSRQFILFSACLSWVQFFAQTQLSQRASQEMHNFYSLEEGPCESCQFQLSCISTCNTYIFPYTVLSRESASLQKEILPVHPTQRNLYIIVLQKFQSAEIFRNCIWIMLSPLISEN